MKTNKYEGSYRIAKSPDKKSMRIHNAISWEKVEELLSATGGVSDFDALTMAVKGHESGSKSAPHPYQFIIYCIKRGWLKSI